MPSKPSATFIFRRSFAVSLDLGITLPRSQSCVHSGQEIFIRTHGGLYCICSSNTSPQSGLKLRRVALWRSNASADVFPLTAGGCMRVCGRRPSKRASVNKQTNKQTNKQRNSGSITPTCGTRPTNYGTNLRTTLTRRSYKRRPNTISRALATVAMEANSGTFWGLFGCS